MTDGQLLVEVERSRVRELLHDLTQHLVVKGAIRSQQWRGAFERTPRHPFVPRFQRHTPSGDELLDGTIPEQRQKWLAAVYTDDALVIQLDEEDPNVATSSSTMPTLMAIMLEALDVHDGHKVLEIGTGTGYNAALLCERLGSGLVTTIDIDHALVETARERLAAVGYSPEVTVADGAGGYPPNAPYDRIIATCSILRVPPPWLIQSRVGGTIVANILGDAGGLVRLEVTGCHSGQGRFLKDSAWFMAMRGSRPKKPSPNELIALVTGSSGVSRPFSPLSGIEDESFRFLMQFALPNTGVFQFEAENHYRAACLWDLRHGSWARAETRINGEHKVTQGGSRRLWDELELAHELWLELGKPPRDRYGLTITPEGRQYVWLDSPDGDHAWDLPAESKVEF